MKKDKIKKITKSLKVIADETRLGVATMLMRKTMSVQEMNKVLKVEPSLLSHHLKTLKSAGIVKGERKGKQVLYSLQGGVGAALLNGLNLNSVTVSFK